MKPDGGQAFPVPGLSNLPNDNFIHPFPGMTLRDWFAGQALSAMDIQILVAEPAAQYMATSAFIIADKMIAERERES